MTEALNRHPSLMRCIPAGAGEKGAASSCASRFTEAHLGEDNAPEGNSANAKAFPFIAHRCSSQIHDGTGDSFPPSNILPFCQALFAGPGSHQSNSIKQGNHCNILLLLLPPPFFIFFLLPFPILLQWTTACSQLLACISEASPEFCLCLELRRLRAPDFNFRLLPSFLNLRRLELPEARLSLTPPSLPLPDNETSASAAVPAEMPLMCLMSQPCVTVCVTVCVCVCVTVCV